MIFVSLYTDIELTTLIFIHLIIMIQENKQEVYIPIEIKPREFVSQLLLCGELAKTGKRVYLGSKTAIDKTTS